ncbi:MAG: single-stranded-DNA-specific exonuclease [Candidatus Tokpelaia sp. JSC188]|nr:MAG: single-stranded-DNA-specific exonuclease [Candidatus Tokpelaia sp. JSC188]
MHYLSEKKDLPFFLGIQQSATNKIWLDRLDPPALNNALAIAQKYGFSDSLARVLSARGVDEIDAEVFVNPTLRTLMPNPSTFTDMQRTAVRIADACLNHEQVVIFGDYDVDGACASAILARFFTSLGLRSRIYIPDRINEGYGPNAMAMHNLAIGGISLIVTVDCGANSIDAIKAARIKGTEVIVLDHHQVLDETLHKIDWPQVNPNRPDDLSGQGHLCAAGVVFMTLVAVSRVLRERGQLHIPDLLAYLDLVALATICDMVPLIGINRAFVVKGLQVAQAMHNPGLSALTQIVHINEPLNTFHFSYILGPCINAGGRIGNPALGAQLLTCQDCMKAMKIAKRLSELNQERKEIETCQLQEAETQILPILIGTEITSSIVVSSKNWHPGIVGLIASRLKERMNRPVLAIAIKTDGMGIGSIRSISGINVGTIIADAVAEGLIEKGGGHAMAAGLTVRSEKIAQLRVWFEEAVTLAGSKSEKKEALLIDGVLSATGVTPWLIQILEKAGPYGVGHDAPIFAFPKHKLINIREIGKKHISVSLAGIDGNKLKGIAFRAIGTLLGDFLFANRMNIVHLAGNLSLNYWNGYAAPQMHILDAAACKI